MIKSATQEFRHLSLFNSIHRVDSAMALAALRWHNMDPIHV